MASPHALTTLHGRTRFACAAPGEPPWELWQREPTHEFADRVAGLWAGSSPEAGAVHRTLPVAEVVLMFHLGPGQRMAELDGRPCDEGLRSGFVTGLQERPSTFVAPEADTRVATLRLRPLGAWALLGGRPLRELTGRVVALDALDERRLGLEPLRQRMLEAPHLGAVLDLLEDWLCERLRRARSPHDATRASSQWLLQRCGAVRVDALSRAVGLSPRRLHELYVHEVGVSPKRLARLVRFHTAVERLAARPDRDLTELALDCGYYDESHLYRDFRALATMTPLAYLRAHDGGLDGPHVVSPDL